MTANFNDHCLDDQGEQTDAQQALPPGEGDALEKKDKSAISVSSRHESDYVWSDDEAGSKAAKASGNGPSEPVNLFETKHWF